MAEIPRARGPRFAIHLRVTKKSGPSEPIIGWEIRFEFGSMSDQPGKFRSSRHRLYCGVQIERCLVWQVGDHLEGVLDIPLNG